MRDCPFGNVCLRDVCDKACPTFAEISYLLERNSLLSDTEVYTCALRERDITLSRLHQCEGKFGCVITQNTIESGKMYTYCAVCENWRGNQLHCSVYHLKFSQYVDLIHKEYGLRDPLEQLALMNIWIESAKVLIISAIDFVQFKDHQAQLLLNIIRTRQDAHQTTIVISPKLSTLVGNGDFFARLREMLGEAVISK